ncbi:MAG: hypothetical protein L6R39_006618, partial [Caloplaca ligustica]
MNRSQSPNESADRPDENNDNAARLPSPDVPDLGTASSAIGVSAAGLSLSPAGPVQTGSVQARNPFQGRPVEQANEKLDSAMQRSLHGLRKSLCDAANTVLSPTFRKDLQLCELDLKISGHNLGDSVFRASLYTRYREEWDGLEHEQHKTCTSTKSQILRKIHKKEEEAIRIPFLVSGRDVVGHYLMMERFQRLFGLQSSRDSRKAYLDFIAPLIGSFRQIQKMLFRAFDGKRDAGIISSMIQLMSSISGMRLSLHESLDAWVLVPSGRYRRLGLVGPELRHSLNLFGLSMARLVRPLSDAIADLAPEDDRQRAEDEQQEMKATVDSYARLHKPATHLLQPDGSPVYLRIGSKDGKSASPVKCLQQTSWPKTPHWQSSAPLTNLRTVVSAPKPKAADFHTSAIARSPPAAAVAAIENETSAEEETAQVSRGDETAGHQAGSPLGYHIPEAKLRESMQASRSTRSAYWQYTLYEGPQRTRVKVHYCKSLETTERIAKLFLGERMVGFDIEWKPQSTVKDGIRKNVAMIQVASEERIALFHVARFAKGDRIEDLVAPSFRQIMETDSIIKVGVSIKSDCTRLRNFMKIDSRGLFELSHLYKLVKFASNEVKKINKKLVSLAKQTEEHLLLPMYKDESVRASDWSEDLNYEQIYYAASDSYAGFQLYHILNNKRLALAPTPPLPAHAELNLPIRLANGQTVAEYEDPSAEEPPPPAEPADDAPSLSTEQLAEDVMNLQIEDNNSPSSPPPPVETTPANQPKLPAAAAASSLSLHPSIVAANEWIAQYRAASSTAAPSTIPIADLSYP